MAEREASVYGLRACGRFFYVGATARPLRYRLRERWNRRVNRICDSVNWEMVVLETVPVSSSAARERYWISKMESDGNRLWNVAHARGVVLPKKTVRRVMVSVGDNRKVVTLTFSRDELEGMKAAALADNMELGEWFSWLASSRVSDFSRRLQAAAE